MENNNNNIEYGGFSYFSKNVVVGAYTSAETEVIISTNCLTFWVLKTEEEKRACVDLTSQEIAKIIFCYSSNNQSIPLLIYPTPSAVKKIRDEMKLTEEIFRASTITNALSRIFMLIDAKGKSEDLLKNLKIFCGTKLEELNFSEALELLKGYQEFLSDLKETVSSISKVTRRDSVISNARSDRIILHYPPIGSHSITIFSNDYVDLAPCTYLNDAIIDFYIKYLVNEKISEDLRKRIHVFNSFFYKKLTAVEVKDSNAAAGDYNKTSEEKDWERYQRVAKWDGKVKLFEKDFIFVPINLNEHWFLAVICYPYLEGRTLHAVTREEVDIKNDKSCPVIQSCILIFDSLGIDRPNVSKNLRFYLRQRYVAENNGTKICDFSSKIMPGNYVKAPKQQNYYDCGIFVLQYVESFLLNPIESYRTPIKGVENWFEQSVIKTKRQAIKELIEDLVKKNEPHNLPLPEINFNYDSQDMEEVEIIKSPPSTKEEDLDKDWEQYNITTQ